MKRRASLVRPALLCVCMLAVAARADAQTFTVELVGGRQTLSGGYGDGESIGLRARYERPRNVWYAAAAHEARFDDAGFIASIANTHILNEAWYTHLGIAAATEAIFLPRYRADVQLARKFGAERRWVATVLGRVSAAHDEHRDAGAGIGLMHYFGQGVVVDGSVFWNRSRPGDVIARRQQLAVSWLRPMRFQISARVSTGGEAYQIVGPDALLVDFNSTDVTVSWQQWLSGSTGITVSLDYYDNPAYQRTGITASVFKQFGP